MSELHRFIFEGMPVRGMLVRLTDAWTELLQRREKSGSYPEPVRDLLGEMAAAAVLMQANIKFDGALVLQIQGDGPVRLAVAEVQPDLALRATATVTAEVAEGAGLEALVNVTGKGRCAITLDRGDKQPGQQPYQGIVGLQGDRREPLQRLSEVLEHYMLQSEQLDTKLVLAADGQVATGLLIQRLPAEGSGNLGAKNEDGIGMSEDYRRIALLAGTLSREELLRLDAQTLLRRLFWEETLRRFPPLSGPAGPRFACRCSRQRVAGMLRSLGRDEIDGLIEERGTAEVACEFCGAQYRFDAVDVGEVFTPAGNQPPASSGMH
jgi:molecular chaperone Hsp33